MANFTFNTEIITSLAAWHSDFSLLFFTVITNLGDFTAYLAILCVIYLAIDKNKGYQLIFIVVFSSVFNAIAKIIIANPRPPNVLHQVEATNYSTPSGHAQVAASFWSALALNFRKNWLVFLAIVFSFLIGFSRTFLGVHYFEDVLLGWSIGFTLTILLIIFWDRFLSIPTSIRILLIFIFTVLVSAFSGMAVGFKEIGENITTYCGLLFGLVAARNIELKYLNFSALSSSFWNGLLKFIIGFSLTIFVWLGFSEINSLLLGEDTTGIVAYIFRYLRYFLVAFTAVYLTPLILVVLKIAKNNL